MEPQLNFIIAKPPYKLLEHCHIQSGLLHTVSHPLRIKQSDGFYQTSMPLLKFTTAKPLYILPEQMLTGCVPSTLNKTG